MKTKRNNTYKNTHKSEYLPVRHVAPPIVGKFVKDKEGKEVFIQSN